MFYFLRNLDIISITMSPYEPCLILRFILSGLCDCPEGKSGPQVAYSNPFLDNGQGRRMILNDDELLSLQHTEVERFPSEETKAEFSGNQG